VFWVAAAASYVVDGITYTASDSNDGLSPARALLTLGQAVTNATADVNDVIVLLHGAHSWAASVALSKAGLTIMGLPGGKGHPERKRTTITTSAADEVINITAADIEIAHLTLIPVTAQRGIDYTAAADRLYIHDCSVDMYTPAVNIATIGIGPTTASIAADRMVIEDCYFESDGAQGVAVDLGNPAGATIRRCKFVITTGTWAAAVGINQGTGGYALIEDSEVTPLLAGIATIGFRGTTSTPTHAVTFLRNYFGFSVTVSIDEFETAGTAVLAENYKGNTGAGSGGAIVTAIT
jgi:hypothetical protein